MAIGIMNPDTPITHAEPPGDRQSRWELRPVGHIRSPYQDSKSVPKGLGAQHQAEGILEIDPSLADGLQDIEGFSHLYVIWVFHQAGEFQLITLNPADHQPHGVFATRVPDRPNRLGMTLVQLLRREGNTLYLRGVDMLDGTPVVDIKPCTSGIDAAALRRGWLGQAEERARAQASLQDKE